jgi:hypothetical protein
MASQPSNQERNLLVGGLRAGCERAERQTHAQVLGATGCSIAEPSQGGRMAVKVGGELAIRLHFERDMADEPRGKNGWRNPAANLPSRSVQGGTPYFRFGGEVD